MRLDRDFSEFIGFLSAHEVRFLVVGGYAVAVHGHPRYTGDLDVWVLVHGGLTIRADVRTLAVVPTSRRYLTENEIARRLLVFFGDRADPTVSQWSAAHTDLHWANLMEPDLVIVDWEGWGIAPVGFDAATLYVHSLLQPAIAEQVRAEFNELLEHRDGLISQLYVTTRMLLRIEHGDYPDLAVLLHRNAERVLRQLSGRR
ncbi:MAG: hypothetical protein ACRDQ4_06070 [Pseudonocardiaceae bacterium]